MVRCKVGLPLGLHIIDIPDIEFSIYLKNKNTKRIGLKVQCSKFFCLQKYVETRIRSAKDEAASTEQHREGFEMSYLLT
jgi:hypothetical protein